MNKIIKIFSFLLSFFFCLSFTTIESNYDLNGTEWRPIYPPNNGCTLKIIFQKDIADWVQVCPENSFNFSREFPYSFDGKKGKIKIDGYWQNFVIEEKILYLWDFDEKRYSRFKQID